jgi:hypothetical protein
VHVGLQDGRLVEVPTRTKRICSIPPYSLHTAVRHDGQRKIRCGLPLSVGTAVGCGSPASISMRSVSISALSTKAEPVWRWQSRQWQQCTNIGSDLRR